MSNMDGQEQVWEYIGQSCWRRPVPGGWLIRSAAGGLNGGVALLFITDNGQGWQI